MSGFATDPTPSLRVDRRTLLKRASVAGAGVIGARLLVPGRAGAQDATVKADPAVKRGGTLRFGVNSAPAHFDVHQSGTVGNVEKIYDAWHNRVRGQNPDSFFGIYDVVRCDTVSIAS